MNGAFTINVVYMDNTSLNVMEVRQLFVRPAATGTDIITFLKLPASTTLANADDVPYYVEQPLADQGVVAGGFVYIKTPRF